MIVEGMVRVGDIRHENEEVRVREMGDLERGQG